MPLDAAPRQPQRDKQTQKPQPLTTFADSIDHCDLDIDVIFTRLTKAFPCCQHVISVRDLKPKHVTEMMIFEITTKNPDGATQTFICKIPAKPERWNAVQNSIALRKRLDSPMVPKLHRVISVKGLYRNNPEFSMPVTMEEFIPHTTTVETDTRHLSRNPAQYLDSLVIHSLQLFYQAASAGYAMMDNTARNIAIINDEKNHKDHGPQFVYIDLGNIAPLIERAGAAIPFDRFQTTLKRFRDMLQNLEKQLPTEQHAELSNQLETFITYLHTCLQNRKETSNFIKEEPLKKPPPTQQQILEDLEKMIETYIKIRTETPGPKMQITPLSLRNAKTPEGMPDFIRRAIRKLLRVAA